MAELYGWAFPIETDPLTGRIKTATDEQLVRQSIAMILSTVPGERYYYPDFGCNLRGYVFEAVNYTTLKQIEADVRRSLSRWEKRIELQDVKVFSENNASIIIDITYQLGDNGTVFYYRHNLGIQ